MTVAIVAEQGTHLLIADGERFAVIERRDQRLFNCHDDRRAGIAVTELSAVGQILDDGDWTDRETAEKTFGDIAARGTGLAERMR
ncbi:MAG TPA: hypothetical protein VGM32_19040 [Rhodopila sp.]|jgi:hypothetical protein